MGKVMDLEKHIIPHIKMRYCIVIIFFLIYTISVSQNNSAVILVEDIDGNTYQTVKIGNQIWFKENLKVTHFKNGDTIETTYPDTLDITINTVQPKFQWKFMNDSMTNIYGRLYTWYTVADKRGLCPDGWRVPSDEDFCILENFIEPGIDINCNKAVHRGTYIGNSLKEAGHEHWADPETGADNKTGFTALPVVIRTMDGNFRYFGLYAYFWTKTEFDSKQAWSRRLYHDTSDIMRGYYFKKDALSVRCVKDD